MSLIQILAYGYAKMPSEPLTPETLLDCGSASKSMTAAAVALLVDDDRFPDVQWTNPVSKLLPNDFVLPNAQLTNEVTIEDILSHRSGIASHDDSYFSVRAKHPDNAKSLTRNLRNLQFAKPLRTTFMYSNIMYTVASHLVETVSGLPYGDYLRQRLWEPLEMTNTFHDLRDIKANKAMDRTATGYYWEKNTKEYVAIPAYQQPEGQGAGCIFSSAGDYAKWIRALLKRSPPLSEAAHKELVTPRSIIPIEEKRNIPFSSTPLYTLGLVHQSYRGHTLMSHTGSVPGFRSVVCYMPELDWGLVIIANGDSAYFLEDILMFTLIDEILNVPKEQRIDWSTLFLEWHKMDEAEAGDSDVDPELTKLENPESLGIPLENLAGTYHNAGYKDLVLQTKDGKLVADCNDRCFPFVLTFEHLTGDEFIVIKLDSWVHDREKLRGKARIEGSQVVSVGVDLEEDLEGHLIWFDRVQ
jgi:CubicO group peptidase (beta-lactamase class C family)